MPAVDCFVDGASNWTSEAKRLKVLVRSLTLIFSCFAFSIFTAAARAMSLFSLSSLIEAFRELLAEAIDALDDTDGDECSLTTLFLVGKEGAGKACSSSSTLILDLEVDLAPGSHTGGIGCC